MRHLTLATALVLLLAACGDGASSGDDATTTTVATTTTTTTTTTAPPTTVAPETTTTTVPSAGEAGYFETIPGTPPAVFDSFASTLDVTMGIGETSIEMSGAGAWTGDAFECSLTMGIGGLGLSQSVVATQDRLWLDNGNGYAESGLFGPAQDVLSGCPASPLFWGDFAAEDFGRAVGNTEDFAGRSAVRLDLTEMLDFAGGFGVIPDLEGAVINAMTMWVDEETNVVLGVFADIVIDSAALGDLGLGTEPVDSVEMTMDLRVEQVNDPAVSIDLPG